MAGRATPRRSTMSCWRSSAFSARICARLRSRSPPVPATCVPTTGRAHRQARTLRRTPATRRVNQRDARPNIPMSLLPGSATSTRERRSHPFQA